MGKLFSELAIVLVFGLAIFYLIYTIFGKKKATNVSSLNELKDKTSKNKQEREALKGDLSSAESTLNEIRQNTN